MENNIINLSQDQVKIRQNTFITNVYGLMTGALAITGFIAWYVMNDENLVQRIAPNFRILLLLEFGVVLGLSYLANKVSVNVARLLFVFYSALNGLTFGAMLSFYTTASIASTFFVTAGTFGIMSIYGYYTKRDLTSIGRILIMALIGIFIASIVNFFLHSPQLYWVVTYVGVIIFVGLVAYDTQKLKALSLDLQGEEMEHKASIIGALILYLDFINLFLLLFRIMGRRR